MEEVSHTSVSTSSQNLKWFLWWSWFEVGEGDHVTEKNEEKQNMSRIISGTRVSSWVWWWSWKQVRMISMYMFLFL